MKKILAALLTLVMVFALFTVLAIVGIVWLVKRLLRKFGIKK